MEYRIIDGEITDEQCRHCLAERMDKTVFLYEATDYNDAFSEILAEYGESSYGRKKYNSEELKSLYYPYHSLDPEQAVQRILDQKHFAEADMIAEGVKIMRRVRERRIQASQA